MKIKVAIEYEEDTDFYTARCLNFYDLWSQGDSEEDAFENLQQIVQDYLDENELALDSDLKYEIVI